MVLGTGQITGAQYSGAALGADGGGDCSHGFGMDPGYAL